MGAPERDGPVAPYHDKEAWLEVHRTGIGGSDAPAVVGFDPYRSWADVYDAKKGITGEIGMTSDMRRGVKQEPIAADKYVEETGRKVRRQPLKRHPEHEWMICDIDRQIVGHERGPGLLEIKVPRVGSFYEIRDEGLPEQYIIQLHHNMICWGYDWSSFAVYTPEYDDLIYFDVALDEELARWLIQEESRFWGEYVEQGVRPGPRERPDPPEFPDAPGEAEIREDATWYEAARDFRRAEAQREIAKQGYKEAKRRLLELASGGDEEKPLNVQGCSVRVKRTWCKGRRSFQKERLLNDHPEIEIDDYYERGKPYARTRIETTEPADVGDLEVYT